MLLKCQSSASPVMTGKVGIRSCQTVSGQSMTDCLVQYASAAFAAVKPGASGALLRGCEA